MSVSAQASEATKVKRTFLFYLVGDGPHLETEAIFFDSIKRTFRNSPSADVLVWMDPFVQGTSTVEWSNVGAQVNTRDVSKETQMGEIGTLKSFFKRAIELEVSLEEIHLVMSGHGRGAFGFGYDYQGRLKPKKGAYDYLSLEEINEAVSELMALRESKAKIDAIYYLGCLMGNLSWVLGHQSIAEYVIANPGLDFEPDFEVLLKDDQVNWEYFKRSRLYFEKPHKNISLEQFLLRTQKTDPSYQIYQTALFEDWIVSFQEKIKDVFPTKAQPKSILKSPFRDLQLSFVHLGDFFDGEMESLTLNQPSRVNVFWMNDLDWKKRIKLSPKAYAQIQTLLGSQTYQRLGLSEVWKQTKTFSRRQEKRNQSWSEFFEVNR